ncbi:DNA-3-methyladenine glycosylase 2 [Paenibacillus glycinis]|uniref:DNA-3-methyladenine glycosylase II n=1 Tax=Paenibacillus glycinis TaxID=2697035 RepID=A0ABW9XL90_9BACL|nr:DNA-3-methyladenine glycosylase [Paenibacillus glycinis]NBD23395.1 DNA-3-methyladenine glycosylase [Paenibacillus glycinis]
MTVNITLTPPEAFSFPHMLGYMERSSNECLYRVDDAVLSRLIRIGETPVLVVLSELADGKLSVACPNLPEAQARAMEADIVAYVRDWFDMDRDLAPFLELASRDAVLSGAAERFGGLRIVGIADLFEALCWGIMGQQINLTFAYALKRRFVEKFGEALDWDGDRHWLFPSPERIAGIDPAELRELQFTGRKAEYVIGTARLMADGALSKEGLLALPDWTAMEKALTGIRGIGPWTANYVLMRCLRMPGAFPIEDVGLHNALKTVLGREDKPSIAEIRELSAGWGEWKAYATFYLWRLLY